MVILQELRLALATHAKDLVYTNFDQMLEKLVQRVVGVTSKAIAKYARTEFLAFS